MAPFEALYGRRCHCPVGWFESKEPRPRGDWVFFRVSPMKGVIRFGRRGKLSPRYIGPFEILRAVGEVAYELALTPALSAIHLMFHVSMRRRYVLDESHVLQCHLVELDDRLTFVEEPVAILPRDVK
ncbi:hypothetical protein MTR67_022957 [Solanum verrucosum]|uniref:Tf2-1-like SH3-like domain-containing protein n=1 Tax=Solanum verrucosum TaxID=315347 RepID=A0AAF0TQZ8_SOLVR|nr:hypothetical protein MTR67_022957 [Solanum verrucosum]